MSEYFFLETCFFHCSDTAETIPSADLIYTTRSFKKYYSLWTCLSALRTKRVRIIRLALTGRMYKLNGRTSYEYYYYWIALALDRSCVPTGGGGGSRPITVFRPHKNSLSGPSDNRQPHILQWVDSRGLRLTQQPIVLLFASTSCHKRRVKKA